MQPEVMSIRVDNRKMWATACLEVPVAQGTFFTADYVENELYKRGIVAGIRRDVIADMIENPVVGREYVVAEAMNPITGDAGYFEYKVDIRDEKNKPTIREDGSVDYYNSLSLAMVNVGDFLVEYFPAKEGTPGYNIYNEELPARKGKEQPRLKGSGFNVSDDGREYYSTTNGRIYLQDDKLIISPVYIVNGDLGIEEGNIRFNGDVEIKGDVRSSLEITTEGSIFIHGHVGGCKLRAGKNITIRQGVQGREKCIIEAGGDVACSFVERCVIKSGGNVYADSIMSSEVAARNQVIVSSKKGLILGGNILGSRGVICKTVGNQVGITTNLQSGFCEEVVKRAGELVDIHYKILADLELLDRNMVIYNVLEEEKRTHETENTRKKILQAKILKTTEQKKVEEELAQINKEMQMIREEGMVQVSGVVYSGTRINIGRQWLEIKEDYKDVVFIQKADFVDVLPRQDFKPKK